MTVLGVVGYLLLALAGACAALPGLVLRVFLWGYPADDPRRRELWAELCAVKRRDRASFVLAQMETVLLEGVVTRLLVALKALRRRYARSRHRKAKRLIFEFKNPSPEPLVDVIITAPDTDHGADLIIQRDGRVEIIQAKHHASPPPGQHGGE